MRALDVTRRRPAESSLVIGIFSFGLLMVGAPMAIALGASLDPGADWIIGDGLPGGAGRWVVLLLPVPAWLLAGLGISLGDEVLEAARQDSEGQRSHRFETWCARAGSVIGNLACIGWILYLGVATGAGPE